MQLSLGPVQYYWSRKDLLQFYGRILDTPLSCLYLGEVVCGKRHELRSGDWIELGLELAGNAQGKQIVLSSLTLIESNADLNSVRRLCENGDLQVEANDMAAAQMLIERGLPFIAGPALNIYNAPALNFLRNQGLYRWVPPVELGHHQICSILNEVSGPVETEIFAWGRQPLAYSARCFTARHHGLSKDSCEHRCAQYPEGLALNSQEGQPLFTLNGIATLSQQPVNLIGRLAELELAGANYLRISPEWHTADTIIDCFSRALRGEPVNLPGGTDGYWRQTSGMDIIASDQS